MPMRTCSTGTGAPEVSRAGNPGRVLSTLPLWLGLGTAAMAGLAQLHLAGRLALPVPGCLWRTLYGLPCPSCGVTRSLAAWTQLDPAAALRFHPLCFLACLTLLAWGGLALLDRLTGRAWLGALQAHAAAWPVWRTLAVLALLNWVYLILALPR